MTRIIDTHSHIFSKKFENDRAEVMQRARSVCSHLLMPNIDIDTIDQMHAVEDENPGFCYSMMGLHPTHVTDDYEKHLKIIEDWLNKRNYIAIGETGTDLYWDKANIARQQDSLKQHAQWAKDYKLPLVLHCRDSFEETLEVVEAAQDGSLSGVFHCFTGDLAIAQRIIDLGFYLGIGGVLTYKSSTLKEVIPQIDPACILLETDCPYLAPVPMRGKRNESSYIQHVAEYMADVLGLTVDEVRELTTTNAYRLFESLQLK